MEMVYSGITEARAKGGEVVLISKNLRVCAKKWWCMNERLMKMRLRLDNGWLAVVRVYGPMQKTVWKS